MIAFQPFPIDLAIYFKITL